jgi:hypothetical protein
MEQSKRRDLGPDQDLRSHHHDSAGPEAKFSTDAPLNEAAQISLDYRKGMEEKFFRQIDDGCRSTWPAKLNRR